MSSERSAAVRRQVLSMQIILGGMAMGAIFFGAIVTSFLVKPAQWRAEAEIITLVALASASAAIPLSFVVPQFVVNAARQRIARGQTPAQQPAQMPPQLAALGVDGPLLIVYQTAMIVGAALCEGAAFFSLIAAMMDRSLVALGIAAVCLLAILVRFPTVIRVENWLAAQHQAMEADRLRMP